MATSAPSLARAAGPLARATVSAVRGSALRAAVGAALRRLEIVPAVEPVARHALSPAALRVERARSRRDGERSELTAVTVWFGQGPSLPSAGGGDPVRSAMRIGTGVLGAAALAAMTVIAARREEERAKVIEGTAVPTS